MPEPIISWFFAFNDHVAAVYDLVVGAVRSSLPFAMDRYCVCDTTNETIVAFLESYGVRVVRARVSFDDALERSDLVPPDAKAVWRGAGLRIDVPRLVDEHSLPVGDYYLYTDTDVIFLRDPAEELFKLTPAYFAASGEFTQDESPPYFNTGVLWANLRSMQETYSGLIEFLNAHQCGVWPELGPFDQGLLNAYYRGKIDFLPCIFNWKPYWGFNEDAAIVHFHGPKPHDLRARLQGVLMPPIYETLYAMRPDSPEVYQRYLDFFDQRK